MKLGLHQKFQSKDQQQASSKSINQFSRADNIVPGQTALEKIKQLAGGLYQSTPLLEKDMPQQVTQIFTQQNQTYDKRGNYNKNSNNTHQLSQQDMIKEMKKRDSAIRGIHKDHKEEEQEAKRKYILLQDAKQENEALKDKLIMKQEYFIKREQEYRKTIDDIHQEIAKRSSDPFGFLQQNSNGTSPQKEAEGVIEDDDENEAEQAAKEKKELELLNQKRREIYMNSKNSNDILGYYDQILKTIERVQKTTAQALETQRNEICEVLDNRLEEIKKQIKDEKAKKGENSADFKEREKELNDHLQTMTQIAQKIDYENRELMKKNNSLTIQVKSQENDRELLLQQMLYERQQGKKLQSKLKKIKEDSELLERDYYKNVQLSSQKKAPTNSAFHLGLDSIKFTNSQLQQQSNSQLEGGGQSTNEDGSSLPKVQSKTQLQNQFLEHKNNTPIIRNAKVNVYGNAMVSMQSIQSMGSLSGATPQKSQFRSQVLDDVSGQNNTQKLQRYEQIITQIKKLIDAEKRSNFQVRTLYSKDMDVKKQLENVLRSCIEDVREEIQKKKNETANVYKKGGIIGNSASVGSLKQIKLSQGNMGQQQLIGEQLTQQEKERIIEVLMSQERVLTLLYDKTFPPRKDNKAANIALFSSGNKIGNIDDIIRGDEDDDETEHQQYHYQGTPQKLSKNSSMPQLRAVASAAKTSTLSNILNRNPTSASLRVNRYL